MVVLLRQAPEETLIERRGRQEWSQEPSPLSLGEHVPVPRAGLLERSRRLLRGEDHCRDAVPDNGTPTPVWAPPSEHDWPIR